MPPKKVQPKTVKPVAASGRTATSKAVPKKPVSSGAVSKTKGAASKSVPTKGKTAKAGPPVKKWTAEDDAAKVIQTSVRGFLVRRRLHKQKLKKKEYERQMEELEREAFAKLVRMEQEQAEKDRLKAEEERKRKRDAAKRQKRMLEAAFDGENDEIKMILKEVRDLDDKNGIATDSMGLAVRAKHELDMIDCEDANNNTPLSEAAGGGNVDTIKMLIDHGAHINSRGRFSRTPLYRAAFGGHMDGCQCLLQHGADPRLYADDGQTPEQIAADNHIRDMIADWDIEQTERLLAKIHTERTNRKETQEKQRAFELSVLEDEVTEVEKHYRAWQKKLCRATEELNKRIYEHDNAANLGFDRPEVTLGTIKDAENELEFIKMECEMARDKLSGVRLSFREQMKENAEARGEELPGLKVTMRELDDVLLRDVGNRIKDSGKWPMLLDTSGQSSIFLRYRDTNYIDALNPRNVEKERLRMAILGCIRYGKPLVLDMHEVEMFEQVSDKFNELQPGLMDAIMDKSILTEKVYLKLLRDTDGPEYNKNNFNDLRIDGFKFIIMTKNPFPSDELLERTYPVRIHIPI